MGKSTMFQKKSIKSLSDDQLLTMSHPQSIEEVQSPYTKVQNPGLVPVECQSGFNPR